jgi:hypothetical protein
VAYQVEFRDGTSTILKIAPKQDILIMSYEINIMFSEVDSMRYIGENTDIPLAKILYYDNSLEICESPYFFMSVLEGQSYNALMDSLTDSEKEEIEESLGKYNAQINQLVGEKFGYYGQPQKQGYNWFLVFKSMLEDVYADGEKLNISMGINKKELFEKLEEDKEIFQEVTTPKLVHWDLWAGNVFVKNGKITGLIDFERCLYGDELLEFGFRTFARNDHFLKGYGITEFTDKQKRRILWYDIYLFSIITQESDYRQYVDRGSFHWGTDMCKEAFEKLHGNAIESGV